MIKVLVWAVCCHPLRWKSLEEGEEVKGYVLDKLHLTRLLDIQEELSDRRLDCINESGDQGGGQSCTYKFGYHRQKDRQSWEIGWDHLALEIAREEMMPEDTGASSRAFQDLEVWKRSGSKEKDPGECAIMAPVRGEFSGVSMVPWMKCCRIFE